MRTKSSNFVAMSFDEIIKRYPLTSDGHRFCLSWTMYRELIRIKNQQERRFYKIDPTTIREQLEKAVEK